MEEVIFELKVDERNEFCTIHYDTDIINLDKQEIYDELEKNGVNTGINTKLIDDLISGDFLDSNNMTIASFIPPSKGSTQSLKYLIDIDPEMKEDKFGKIDFYDIGVIKNVVDGDELVEIIPPTIGEPGKDVLGKEIAGIVGDKIEVFPFAGEGTVIDDAQKYIIATKNGVYRINHKKEVSVSDELIVKGDFNFAIGNIDTTSTVIVNGDVRAGFTCKSTSPIIVNGVIEDAEIYTDESLVCKMGILQGESSLIVKKQIKAKYIRNRTHVECKNLFVQDMVSGSNIKVDVELNAKKLVGGNTIVKDIVKLEELGSEQFIPTFIEVGVNPKIVKRLKEIREEISILEKEIDDKNKEIEILDQQFAKLSAKIEELLGIKDFNKVILSKHASQSKKNSDKLKLVISERDEMKNKIRLFEREIARFEKKIEKENPLFEVKGKVFSNVTIKIKNSEPYTVKTLLKNVKFSYDSQDKKVVIETNE